MKKFNVNKQHDFLLHGFKVPHNAIYGEDTAGLFVCTCFNPDRSPYLWRYSPSCGIWRKSAEYNDTLRIAYSIAQKQGLATHYWGNPLNGLRSVTPKMKMPQTATGFMHKPHSQHAIDRYGYHL